MRYIPFLRRMNALVPVVLVFSLQCGVIVNSIAFHPDASSLFSHDRLPRGIEERFITSSDGIRLQCYIVRDTGKTYAALYCHGNSGNNDWQISDLVSISKMGLTVVSVDYRGFGKSSGRPSEKGIYLDAMAGFLYVVDSLKVKESNIFIIGSSLGTAAAINTARNKDIAGLVLVAPFTTGKAYADAHGFGALALAAVHSFDNMSKIGEIQCPLLVIHGTRDEIIPFSMGKALFTQANTRKTFVAIDGGHHGDLAVVDENKYWGAISDFINLFKGHAQVPSEYPRHPG